MAPEGGVVRRVPRRGEAGADPPRPAPARGQVQARGAVPDGERGEGRPAPGGGAGLQLRRPGGAQPGAAGPRRRGDAVPRVRTPDAPRARRAAEVARLLGRGDGVGPVSYTHLTLPT